MGILTTSKQRAKLAKAIAEPNAPWNEVVWSYLLASVLAMSQHRREHLGLLCGEEVMPPEPFEPWFEAQPMPPRGGCRGRSERNSKIDLAFGDIMRRGNPDGSGIAYAKRPGSWVCFVEAKFLSDCSTTVTHDPLRNQLARVIESLLCFQDTNGNYPERLYFTLLTPRHFLKPENKHSRLYGYKMDEYADQAALLGDIERCLIPERNRAEWGYPDLKQRLLSLRRNWVAYEDIFDQEPDLAGLDLVEIAMSRRIPAKVRARLEMLKHESSLG